MDHIFVSSLRSLSISGLNFGSDKTLLNLLPVDNLPNVIEVLWSSILIVKVVGVLPDINSNERHKIRADIRNRILVCGLSKTEWILLLIVGEPSPAWSLDGRSSCVEDFDEAVNIAPTGNHILMQDWSFLWKSTVSLWAKGIPEQLVIDVTTSIEFDCLRVANSFTKVSSSQCFCLLLEQLIQIVNVGSVMLSIVEVESHTRHDWFKSSKFVWQVLELHSCNLSWYCSTESSLDNSALHFFILWLFLIDYKSQNQCVAKGCVWILEQGLHSRTQEAQKKFTSYQF